MKRIVYIVLAVLLLSGTTFAETINDPKEQSLGLEGVDNARELGGYAAGDGKTVKRGVLLRTAALKNATEADLQRLCEVYHLAVVLDLRTTREVESAPDPEIKDVRNLHLPIMDEKAMEERRKSHAAEDTKNMDSTADSSSSTEKQGSSSDQMYVGFLSHDAGKIGYAQMFRELIDLPEGSSLLFHCSQGKDRTGVGAMLILSALGVDEQTILADFLLTNTFNADRIEAKKQELAEKGVTEDERYERFLNSMYTVKGERLVIAMDWMKENYGSVIGYITDALGLSEAELDELREKFLTGTTQ